MRRRSARRFTAAVMHFSEDDAENGDLLAKEFDDDRASYADERSDDSRNYAVESEGAVTFLLLTSCNTGAAIKRDALIFHDSSMSSGLSSASHCFAAYVDVISRHEGISISITDDRAANTPTASVASSSSDIVCCIYRHIA